MEHLIDANVTLSGFFDEAVRGAAETRGYDPEAPSARYVAGLLAEYATASAEDAEMLRQPLTLLYRDAVESAGAARFNKLRAVGDAALYLSGYFADHLERRGVAKQFACGVGRASYDAAAAMLRRAGGATRGPDVFDELATHFDDLVVVLGDVADAVYAMNARDPRGLLEVYERWTKSGSKPLADALLRWGVVPSRGGPSVH